MAEATHLWTLILGHTEHKEPFRSVHDLAWEADGIRVSGTVVDEDVVAGPGDSWSERWHVSEGGAALGQRRDEWTPAPTDERIALQGASFTIADARFEGHSHEVSGVDLGPQRQLVASACSGDKTVRIWDPTGTEILRLSTRQVGRPELVVFSPDGTRIVVACWEAASRYTYSLRAFALELELPTPRRRPPGVRLVRLPIATEARLAVALRRGFLTGRDQELTRWSADQSVVWTRALPALIGGLYPSRDQCSVVVTHRGSLRLVDLESGDDLARHDLGPSGPWTWDVAFSQEGQWICARHGGEVSALSVYDSKGSARWSHEDKELRRISWCGSALLANFYTRLVHFDGPTGEVLQEQDLPFVEATGAPGNQLLVQEGRFIGLYDGAGSEAIWRAERPHTGQSHTAWSPDGRLLATRQGRFAFAVRDAVSGEVLGTGEHEDEIVSLCWREDGSQLASCGDDQTVCLWTPSAQRVARADLPAPVTGISIAGNQLIGALRDNVRVLHWQLDA